MPLSDDGDGKVPLRTYIERMFDERTKTILGHLEMVNERIVRERTYLDELMSMHMEGHRNEQDRTVTLIRQHEDAAERRMVEMAKSVEKLTEQNAQFIPRESLDKRFSGIENALRDQEREMAQLRNLVSAASARRDANIVFIGLGFTLFNIFLALVSKYA